MILHVLPGDSLTQAFQTSGIEGDTAVCRECLVEGDLDGATLPEFWETRARFLAAQYRSVADHYHETVVREFAKLTALQSGSEINLWFEYELFCQSNMWFCLSLLVNSTADIFRVAPVTRSDDDVWDGFGSMSPTDLTTCFAARVELTAADIQLGADLWSAYRDHDKKRLAELSEHESRAFPKLRAVAQAAIEKESRPAQILQEILADGMSDFDEIFQAFKKRAGVYGYGDTQVRNLMSGLSRPA